MTCWQLRFIADRNMASQLADWLEANGALAVTLEGAADQPLFDVRPAELSSWENEAPLWEQIRLTALFSAGVDPQHTLAALSAALSPVLLPPHEIIPLEEQDWAVTWREWCVPTRFGQRLWVHPSWTEPPDPRGFNVVLDPGMAFGTGTHPTTALCLEWLDNHTSLAGVKVIDYGCGSGILALAAAKLGAERVVAVDVDKVALEVTRDNALRNGVSAQIITALPAELDVRGADILLANILLKPLADLAPRFAALVTPMGQVVLSGILERQVTDCLAAYRAWFTMDKPRYSEGWALLQGVRR